MGVELLDGLAIKKQPLLSLEKGGFPNLAWLIRVEESTELRGHNRMSRQMALLLSRLIWLQCRRPA